MHRPPAGDDLLLHNRSTTAAAGPCGQWGRTAAGATTTSASLITPKRSQFDLQVEGLFGFTGPGSIVRVREFETEGTGLHFSNMGMNTEQMPTLDARYWFDEVNAIHLRFRYFNLGGTHFSSSPIKFNGAIIPGGRTNNFDPWEWFAGGLYYERRLTPLYESYEARWPTLLQDRTGRKLVLTIAFELIL